MIRAFDMFCGGGGSSYGAAMAGVTVVGGVDAWSLATEVFADNFPEAVVFTKRVEELEPRIILDKIGSIDLLLASPECTNHSCARGARPRSKASQETALQVVRYACVIKPRWIIIENGLATVVTLGQSDAAPAPQVNCRQNFHFLFLFFLSIAMCLSGFTR